jgi:hypothetical protein
MGDGAVHREMPNLFAVRATVDMFIRAPVVILHFPLGEEGHTQKDGMMLLICCF